MGWLNDYFVYYNRLFSGNVPAHESDAVGYKDMAQNINRRT